jgi:cytosine/uracil/thiamine/allantoin permease
MQMFTVSWNSTGLLAFMVCECILLNPSSSYINVFAFLFYPVWFIGYKLSFLYLYILLRIAFLTVYDASFSEYSLPQVSLRSSLTLPQAEVQ